MRGDPGFVENMLVRMGGTVALMEGTGSERRPSIGRNSEYHWDDDDLRLG